MKNKLTSILLTSIFLFNLTSCECKHKTMTCVDKVEPTCTEKGCESYWYCDDCGALFLDENENEPVTSKENLEIDPLGHDFKYQFNGFASGECSVSASCNDCDYSFEKYKVTLLTDKLECKEFKVDYESNPAKVFFIFDLIGSGGDFKVSITTNGTEQTYLSYYLYFEDLVDFNGSANSYCNLEYTAFYTTDLIYPSFAIQDDSTETINITLKLERIQSE